MRIVEQSTKHNEFLGTYGAVKLARGVSREPVLMLKINWMTGELMMD